ncbi:MAG: hypothetical protein NTV58_06305 [Deltaproteobacteria bacterium]|nr:hypothetical protein [Deltaproteobacteria bacterium]
MKPIFYIGPCSENPYFPSWADLPDTKNPFNDPDIEKFINQELRIATSILDWDASGYEQFYSDGWLHSKAEDAREHNLIDLFELVFILANDTDCTAILLHLWEKCGFDKSTIIESAHILKSCDNGQTWEETEEFEPELPHTRAMAWNWILLRWTTSGKNFFFKMANNNLLPIEETTDNRGKRAEYINLDELECFLSGSSIPLPKLLFPKSQSAPTKKSRPSFCLTEAMRFKKDNPLLNRRKIQELVDRSMKEHNLAPYGRVQFDRLTKCLALPIAPSGNPHNQK